MDLKDKFAILLRNLRKDKKMTISTLSIVSNLSKRYISDLEMGKSTPTLETIFKLSDALKCPADEMIKWIDLQRAR